MAQQSVPTATKSITDLDPVLRMVSEGVKNSKMVCNPFFQMFRIRSIII